MRKKKKELDSLEKIIVLSKNEFFKKNYNKISTCKLTGCFKR